MNRLASCLLLFCFVSLGTGLAGCFHELQHDAEDAIEDAADKAAGRPPESHHHDETNCDVHAQLAMGFASIGWLPILISLGSRIAFPTLLAEPVHSFRKPVLTDCRGPPNLRA